MADTSTMLSEPSPTEKVGASTMLSDTSPEAERVQIELLRRATIAQRFELMRSLSETTIALARRAIRRAHPDVTEEEVGLTFVALHYGQPLADRLRQYLEARRR